MGLVFGTIRLFLESRRLLKRIFVFLLRLCLFRREWLLVFLHEGLVPFFCGLLFLPSLGCLKLFLFHLC